MWRHHSRAGARERKSLHLKVLTYTVTMTLITTTLKLMTEKFQCPGCSNGCNTKCGHYKRSTNGTSCANHVPGTILFPGGVVFLGMPKGFNKAGSFTTDSGESKITPTLIRFFENKSDGYDYLNVPVWAMEHEGYLFVRVYKPRVNQVCLDIIKDGKFSDLPLHPINVAEHLDEID